LRLLSGQSYIWCIILSHLSCRVSLQWSLSLEDGKAIIPATMDPRTDTAIRAQIILQLETSMDIATITTSSHRCLVFPSLCIAPVCSLLMT